MQLFGVGCLEERVALYVTWNMRVFLKFPPVRIYDHCYRLPLIVDNTVDTAGHHPSKLVPDSQHVKPFNGCRV